MKASRSATSIRPSGPSSAALAAARRSGLLEAARANTASAIADAGTPRLSDSCTVQVPVPFMPAASTMTSISGLPVAASTWRSTSAVISIRYESRSPVFHWANTSAASVADNPAPCSRS